MANTENIEAKLCAYVDGELDATGRAEIEAHLEANPQHRQLIAELTGQHKLLADLPRARAPEDLFETVQSQLERAVLLDTGRPAIAGRINPWPARMAKAAVLLLAVGLAAVVYFVLPVSRQAPTHVAMSQGTTGPLTDSGTTLPAVDELSLASADRKHGDTLRPGGFAGAKELSKDASKAELDALAGAPSLATPSTPPASPAAIAPVASASPAPAAAPTDIFSKGGERVALETKGGGVATYTNIFADPAVVEEKLKQAPAVKDHSLVIFVSASDPVAVNKQVQDFCVDNNIRWEQVTESAPDPISQNQALAGARSQRIEGQLRSTAPTEAESELLPQAQAQVPGKGGQEAPQRAARATSAQNGSARAIQAEAATTQTEPSVALQTAPPHEQPPIQLGVAQQQELGFQQPGGQQSQLLIARGLTRRQVSALNSNLALNNSGRVSNYQRNAGAKAYLGVAATQRSDVSVVNTAVVDAVGPATQVIESGERELARKTSINESPATTQPTAPEAVATPAPVSPATAPADQRDLAGLSDKDTLLKFKEQSTSATTTGASVVGEDFARKQSADEAATQPAIDEPVDVVILVQSDPASEAGAVQQHIQSPATVPADATPSPAVTQPTSVPVQQ